MITPENPVDLELEILKAIDDQYDNCKIRGTPVSDLVDLLSRAVACLHQQGSRMQLSDLHQSVAKTRGNEYLKQAIRNNERYEGARKLAQDLRAQLDAIDVDADAVAEQAVQGEMAATI